MVQRHATPVLGTTQNGHFDCESSLVFRILMCSLWVGTFTVLHPFGSIWMIDLESQLFWSFWGAPSKAGKPCIYTQDIAILMGEICGNDDKAMNLRGIFFFSDKPCRWLKNYSKLLEISGIVQIVRLLGHKIHHCFCTSQGRVSRLDLFKLVRPPSSSPPSSPRRVVKLIVNIIANFLASLLYTATLS